MKRKLRIFSNIAIICLSVCMFAFGVYAASTVSVTTSGTVSFNATDVYATVTRKVVRTVVTTNGNSTKTEKSELTNLGRTTTFDSSATTANEVWNDANLEFTVGVGETLTMTYTITNLAADRNINFTFTDNQEVTGTENISKKYTVRRSYETGGIETKYDGTNYNINPSSYDGSTLVVVIEFNVIDANVSASVNYNYGISLSAQTASTGTITATDTAKTTYTRVGNLFVSQTTLANGEYLNNTVTGTENYMEYTPTVSGYVVTTPILVYGSESATISANIRTSLTTSGDVIIPMASANASKASIITSIYDLISDNSTLTTLHLPNTVTSFSSQDICNASKMTTLTMSKGGLEVYSEGNCIIDKERNAVVATCPTSVIPENVTTIGAGAFSYVTYRTTYMVPKHIKVIESYSFASNDTLEELLFEEDSVLEQIAPADSNGFINGVFYYGGAGLKTIGTIPKTVKYLGPLAEPLNGSPKVTTITFEERSQLKELHETFNGFNSLQTVTLPDGLEIIGNDTFMGCALTNFVIPSTVKEIGNSAFYYACMHANNGSIIFSEGIQLEKFSGEYDSNDFDTLGTIYIASEWIYDNLSSDSSSLLYPLYLEISDSVFGILDEIDDGSNPLFTNMESYGEITNSVGTFNGYCFNS